MMKIQRVLKDYLKDCAPEVQAHCFRVGILTETLILEMGRGDELAKGELEDGAVPLSYHDIGKAFVPKSILEKPGALTVGERVIMMRHASFGAGIFEALSDDGRSSPEEKAFCKMGYELCMYHHEWYNGKGYPGQLQGRDIPFIARACAVADAWDAMTVPRCYQEAMTAEAALAEIRQYAGIQFDPEIAEAFCSLAPYVIHRKKPVEYREQLLAAPN